MRFDIWSVIRFLHVAGAIVWVGGQLTLSLVVRPVTPPGRWPTMTGSNSCRLSDPASVDWRASSSSPFSWPAALTYHRGVAFGGFGIPAYGTTLTVKIALALVSFGLAAAHGMTAVGSSSGAVRTVGSVGAVVSLTVVALAASLVRDRLCMRTRMPIWSG